MICETVPCPWRLTLLVWHGKDILSQSDIASQYEVGRRSDHVCDHIYRVESSPTLAQSIWCDSQVYVGFLQALDRGTHNPLGGNLSDHDFINCSSDYQVIKHG
jgi:hypothetical protein